jgi:hypothetical protein
MHQVFRLNINRVQYQCVSSNSKSLPILASVCLCARVHVRICQSASSCLQRQENQACSIKLELLNITSEHSSTLSWRLGSVTHPPATSPEAPSSFKFQLALASSSCAIVPVFASMKCTLPHTVPRNYTVRITLHNTGGVPTFSPYA